MTGSAPARTRDMIQYPNSLGFSEQAPPTMTRRRRLGTLLTALERYCESEMYFSSLCVSRERRFVLDMFNIYDCRGP